MKLKTAVAAALVALVFAAGVTRADTASDIALAVGGFKKATLLAPENAEIARLTDELQRLSAGFTGDPGIDGRNIYRSVRTIEALLAAMPETAIVPGPRMPELPLTTGTDGSKVAVSLPPSMTAAFTAPATLTPLQAIFQAESGILGAIEIEAGQKLTYGGTMTSDEARAALHAIAGQ